MSHHSPPEALGYAFKIVLWVCVEALSIVDQACKDDHPKDKEEDEEGELLRTRLERVDEDLQAGRVTGQLEQPQDPNNGEEFQNVCILDVFEVILQQHVAVKAQGGDEVNPVQGRLDEDFDGGSDDETDDQLEREPDVANELDEEEGLVRVGLSLVQRPEGDVVTEVANRHIADDGNPTVGVGLQAEGQDGDENEEDRGEGNHLKGLGSGCKRGSNSKNRKMQNLDKKSFKVRSTLAQCDE